ncbi:hypothetical protein HPB49_015533 [Dermacentor silvarum]|uniref:Uncharacterized protein n=1 Tax=Dermacentor silvarum TaxID=543639 RepID=A0ACB8CFZ8_DERSI|nr:hypothetical protein HPB49_015533 [Dermacentor silvarum]
MQGTRDPDLRGVFRQQYARASAIYKRNIRSAKESFDKTLCDELTRKHLFGQPFKLAFDKLRPATHLPPLEGVDGTATSSVLGSAALLLLTHVATDDPAGDSDLHRCIRRVVGGAYPRVPDDLPFTPTEIEHAVFLGNPRAAPGLDGLTAMFIRNLFPPSEPLNLPDASLCCRGEVITRHGGSERQKPPRLQTAQERSDVIGRQDCCRLLLAVTRRRSMASVFASASIALMRPRQVCGGRVSRLRAPCLSWYFEGKSVARYRTHAHPETFMVSLHISWSLASATTTASCHNSGQETRCGPGCLMRLPQSLGHGGLSPS